MRWLRRRLTARGEETRQAEDEDDSERRQHDPDYALRLPDDALRTVPQGLLWCSVSSAVIGMMRPLAGPRATGGGASTAAGEGRWPNSVRIASNAGSIVPARRRRMRRSHAGSNFFHPAAY